MVRGVKGDRPAAAADFRRALEVAPPDWPRRAAAEKLLKDLERR